VGSERVEIRLVTERERERWRRKEQFNRASQILALLPRVLVSNLGVLSLDC
jgi:hypothetical protein